MSADIDYDRAHLELMRVMLRAGERPLSDEAWRDVVAAEVRALSARYPGLDDGRLRRLMTSAMEAARLYDRAPQERRD